LHARRHRQLALEFLRESDLARDPSPEDISAFVLRIGKDLRWPNDPNESRCAFAWFVAEGRRFKEAQDRNRPIGEAADN